MLSSWLKAFPVFVLLAVLAAPPGQSLEWGEEEVISWSECIYSPSIASGPSGAVHIVRNQSYYADCYSVVYCRRENGMWTPDEPLATHYDALGYAVVVEDALGIVHVAWDGGSIHDYQVRTRRWTGKAWTDTEGLGFSSSSPGLAAGPGQEVQMVVSSRDTLLHFGWEGSEWVNLGVVDGSGIPRRSKRIVVEQNGTMHVVWADYRHDPGGDNSEIYYARRDDGLWSAEMRLTDAPALSWQPSVVVDLRGDVHVVWSDDRDGTRMTYARRWTDGNWLPEEVLSEAAYATDFPSLAADVGGMTHVVWLEYVPAPPWHVLMSRSWDGAFWSEPQYVASLTGQPHGTALAAGDDGALHLTWGAFDEEEYFDKLFYKRGTIPQSSVGEDDMSGPRIENLRLYPNPFRNTVTAELLTAGAHAAEITILDFSGRVIRRLIPIGRTDGRCCYVWDGRDGNGNRTASGVYLLRTVTRGETYVERIVRLH